MPVTQQYTPEEFDGNGSTTIPYPIGLERDNDEDFGLLVGGIETNDFTVAEDGFRTLSAIPTGTPLILFRKTPIDQENPYIDNTSPSPNDVRQSFDKLTLVAQEIANGVERAIKPKIGESFTSNSTLGLDENGDPVSRDIEQQITHLGISASVEQANQSAQNAAESALQAQNAASSISVATFNFSNDEATFNFAS